MSNCPFCDFENIPGEALCQQCGHSLSDLHLQTPPSEVERSLVHDRVKALNPHDPIGVDVTTPVRTVLRMMVEKSIGCVLVNEGNRLVGIFSERDALRKLGTRAEELSDRPVSEFMTPDPQTLALDAKVAFAVQRMDLGGYRHLPVIDGQPVGVISARDILKYLTAHMQDDD